MAVDPISLTQALIRCPSVTPEDAGALGVLEDALKPLGFDCKRLRFEAVGTAPVENLYARLGTGRPNFCFAGHTDVVPPGDAASWRHDPFAAEIHNGVLYGRGAADMKSAIAAFACATARYVGKHGAPKGAISLLITGDEEGVAVNGTVKVLDWLKQNGQVLDHCLVGEPTSTARTGDVIKIGRRGSMNFRLIVKGTQGHVAYPQRALNPIPVMAELIARIAALKLDEGSDNFDPSTLAFTTVDVGNPAVNVIPAEAQAGFNIRFNDLHNPAGLLQKVEDIARRVMHERGAEIIVSHATSGVSFVTKPGAYTDLLSNAVKRVTGTVPEHSTTGGTSDARFIKDHCPVAELGLPGATMHRTDECASVEDIEILTRIYLAVLEDYFAKPI
ncbi:MAG: succinyl-diaminopimelate desuccinylase [Alphaproteobacteria bacterium]|nr:succinyl-diaminopimelate desuccinylase [Alphaproteobacteria bacterium]